MIPTSTTVSPTLDALDPYGVRTTTVRRAGDNGVPLVRAAVVRHSDGAEVGVGEHADEGKAVAAAKADAELNGYRPIEPFVPPALVGSPVVELTRADDHSYVVTITDRATGEVVASGRAMNRDAAMQAAQVEYVAYRNAA